MYFRSFPLAQGITEKCYHLIYPTKQKVVQDILKVTHDYPVNVILFGSAITHLCNCTSDVDIAIEANDSQTYELIRDLIYKNVEQVDIVDVSDVNLNTSIMQGILIQENLEESICKHRIFLNNC